LSGSGKRRREARRRARQKQEEQRPAQNVPAEGGAERPGPTPREESPAAREGVAHSRAGRKKARRQAGLWERLGGMRISGWMIGVPVVVGGIVVVAVLILTSGSSGGGGPSAGPTPDPRVAGKTPDNSVSLTVDDVNFSLTKIPGKAGEVIEFLVTNTSGTQQSHNMVVAGPDNEYETADDFNPEPFAIKAGETGRVVVKIDDPGTYNFRCAFHPTIEFGTLELE
jgi:plastocyanin